MDEQKKTNTPAEKVDLSEVMSNLQYLPEAEQLKIKYAIQGAAIVAGKPVHAAADRRAG